MITDHSSDVALTGSQYVGMVALLWALSRSHVSSRAQEKHKGPVSLLVHILGDTSEICGAGEATAAAANDQRSEETIGHIWTVGSDLRGKKCHLHAGEPGGVLFKSATGAVMWQHLMWLACCVGCVQPAEYDWLVLWQVAAHQLVYSLWSLCSFATVPLEQVALAFVPIARGDWEQTQTARCIVAAGAVVGVVAGCIASLLTYGFPGAFTSDAVLWPVMRGLAPQVSTCSQPRCSFSKWGKAVSIPQGVHCLLPRFGSPCCCVAWMSGASFNPWLHVTVRKAALVRVQTLVLQRCRHKRLPTCVDLIQSLQLQWTIGGAKQAQGPGLYCSCDGHHSRVLGLFPLPVSVSGLGPARCLVGPNTLFCGTLSTVNPSSLERHLQAR